MMLRRIVRLRKLRRRDGEENVKDIMSMLVIDYMYL